MKSTPRKTGRPTAYHTLPSGEKVDGLSKLADGRWKVSPFPGQPTAIKFSERDEQLAVAKFHSIRGRSDRSSEVKFRVAKYPSAAEAVTAGKRLVSTVAAGVAVLEQNLKQLGSAPVAVDFGALLDRPEVWAWVRRQIIDNPKLVAQKLAIEEIGYLTGLKPPTPSLTVTDAGKVYADFAKVTAEERTRVVRAWGEFAKLSNVNTLGEIDHEAVERYERALDKLELSPKTRKHRIMAVRTTLSYCLRRGRDVAKCRAALDALSMIQVAGANPLDPKPISPTDFWAIYDAACDANDIGFAAMLLLSLNAALYASEAAAMRWQDLDLDRGEMAVRRRKTGVPRVAVLWQETIASLRALPKPDGVDRIFRAARGPHSRQTIFRVWQEYAGKRATFGQIRDAAFTTAARVNIDQARLLAGHRIAGAADNYILRRPHAVADVCNAIKAEFAVAEHVSSAHRHAF